MFVSGKDIQPTDGLCVYDIETVPQNNLSKIQSIELEKRFKRSRLLESGIKEIKVPPYLAEYDKEVEKLKSQFMATSPYFGKIVCIGMYWPTSNLKEALIGDEQSILEKFWSRIDSAHFSGNFVSFNGLEFDMPYIVRRSILHGILPTNEGFLNTYRFQKVPHRDVYLLLSDFGRNFHINLDLACEIFDIPSPKRGEVRAENVADYYEAGKIELIAEYCLKDIIATYLLYDKIRKYFC